MPLGETSTAPAKPVVRDNPQSSSAHSTNRALVHYKAFNLALPSASQSHLGQDSRRGSLPLMSSPSPHRSHSCLRTQCAVSTRGSQTGQGSRAEDGLVKSCLRVEAGVGWGVRDKTFAKWVSEERKCGTARRRPWGWAVKPGAPAARTHWPPTPSLSAWARTSTC